MSGFEEVAPMIMSAASTVGSAIGSGASAVGSAFGSGYDAISKLLSASGAAGAAANSTDAIPKLLAGAGMSQAQKLFGGGDLASALTSAPGMKPMAGMMDAAQAGMQQTPALQEAINAAQNGGLLQGPAMANGAFYSQGEHPIGPLQPNGEFFSRAPNPTGMPPPTITGGPPPGVPPDQPAWKTALAASALVGSQMAQNRKQQPNAPAPNFFIPQGNKAPQIGTSIQRTSSPLQRYAMMLRRV